MGGCCSTAAADHTNSITNTERSTLTQHQTDSDIEASQSDVISESGRPTSLETEESTEAGEPIGEPTKSESSKVLSPGMAGLISIAEELAEEDDPEDEKEEIADTEVDTDTAFAMATHPSSPGSMDKVVDTLEMDDESPMPEPMPPVHLANVEVMIETVDLELKAGRRDSKSAAVNPRFKRMQTHEKKSSTTRSNVYLNALYFSMYEDGTSVMHGKVATGKYNSRSYNANIIDVRETLTFIVVDAMVSEANSKKEDTFYLNDRIHFSIKQTMGALRKPKILGHCDMHLHRLSRDGEWTEWEMDIRPTESADHVSEGECTGKVKVKGRFIWSVDTIREYRSTVLSKAKKRNSEKRSSFNRAMSVKDHVLSLDVFADTQTSLSSIHGFIMTEDAILKMHIIGVLFGMETAEEWSFYKTADEVISEMKQQGTTTDASSPDLRKLLLNNIWISAEYRCKQNMINHQTDPHSSKADEVLYIGEDMQFTVEPFEDDGELSEAQKMKHPHPQYLFFLDKKSWKLPGCILLRALIDSGGGKRKPPLCVGVCLVNVLDVVSQLRQKDDPDNPILLRLNMFKWLSEDKLDQAIRGGSKAMQKYEHGCMIIQVQCEFT